MPHEALVNDDIGSYGGPHVEDNGFGIHAPHGSQEIYLYKDIPHGWTATAFRTYGTSGGEAVTFYTYDITDTTATADGNAGTLNGDEITLASPVASEATNYVGLKIETNSSADIFYGGYIKIERKK